MTEIVWLFQIGRLQTELTMGQLDMSLGVEGCSKEEHIPRSGAQICILEQRPTNSQQQVQLRE